MTDRLWKYRQTRLAQQVQLQELRSSLLLPLMLRLTVALLVLSLGVFAYEQLRPAARPLQAPGLQHTLPLVPHQERQRSAEYVRTAFGVGWQRQLQCTTREQIIARDLVAARFSPQCRLLSGTGHDPYSGMRIGPATAGLEPIEVDHIFPLAAAWDLGASSWTPAARQAFANDPANLVAASRRNNQDKGDSLPAAWQPPQRRQRCWYARQLAAVALKYQLALPRADRRAMWRACPQDLLRLKATQWQNRLAGLASKTPPAAQAARGKVE